MLGAGDFKLTLGGFTLGGIGTATFGAIILYHLLNQALPPAGTREPRGRAASRTPKTRRISAYCLWYIDGFD